MQLTLNSGSEVGAWTISGLSDALFPNNMKCTGKASNNHP